MQQTTRRIWLGLAFVLMLLGLHVLALQALNRGPADMSFNEWMEMQKAQRQHTHEQE